MVLNKNIIDLINARAANGSLPGQRNDGRHLALAIEGGGMRGVVSAGMVVALDEMGLRDCFDSVYGASAGAVTAAYFVAGQARYGSSIFYENINNRDFIDVRRLGSEKPVLSLEYLFQVCADKKPLDTLAVLCSAIPLNVVAASVMQRQPVTLTDFADTDEIFTALKASARIPIFAGDPVAFRDDHFLDASLYEAIPHASACQSGATDVLALLTCPKNNFPERSSGAELPRAKIYFKRFASKRFLISGKQDEFVDELSADLMAQDVRYRMQVEALASDKNAAAIQLCETGPLIHPLEISRNSLLTAVKAGYDSAYATFSRALPNQSPFPDASPARDLIPLIAATKASVTAPHHP